MTPEEILSGVMMCVHKVNPHPDQEIHPESDLFVEKIVDSFGILEMLIFLDQQFNIKIPAESLNDDSVKTPTTITTMVTSLLHQ
jgi:acyl carrier protein